MLLVCLLKYIHLVVDMTLFLPAYRSKCSQIVSTGPDAGNMQGEEDCLNLNIFLPKERDWLLPVMFWIYGGAFVDVLV